MEKKSATKLVKDIFENRYSEEGFSQFIAHLLNEVNWSNTFSSHESGVPVLYGGFIKHYKRLAQYEDPAGDTLDVLAVNLKKETSPKRARTMQRHFIGWYLKSHSSSTDNALVAFYHEDVVDWRFSYVKRSYRLLKDESGKISPAEKLTSPRRFSFLVGKNEPSHTAQTQIVPILENDKANPTLSEVEGAFNVETVTDEFFERYRALFLSLRESLDGIILENPAIKAEFENREIDTVDFAKKLLGQIVFLYFLQKKGWLGVGKGKEWGSGSKSFLRDLFNRRGDKNFFNNYLEPLFYDALMLDRGHIDDYFSGFDCKIPFLNGGLFDPINNYDWVKTDICLPNELFSNKHKTNQGDIGNGILDVFDRYNFTVREDEPLEIEVAIDPEMLGKVFENLLEIRDRKSKGTFYTPRKIVHYMCQESLINYLNTEFGGSIKRDDFEKLVKFNEASSESADIEEDEKKPVVLSPSIEFNAIEIDEKLSSIRVCDPAVGSGAFLVGMMNEIVGVRVALTPYLNEAAKGRTLYSLKRDAIQKCLYGVDIDSGAVEIAKLRLWLSLVVDEKERTDISPLPNLDYRIAKGDALLKYPYVPTGLKEIEKLKEKLFGETDPSTKKKIRDQADKFINQLMGGKEIGLGYKLDFDFRIFFSEVFNEGGFDIVIGNPPYVQLQKMKGDPVRKSYEAQDYRTFVKSGDIYCLFYERGIQIACEKGTLCYITSNKWMRSGYGKKLREFLSCYDPLLLIDLGPNVFRKATVDTNILFIQKNLNEDSLRGLKLDEPIGTNMWDKVDEASVKIPPPTDGPWFIGSEMETSINQKIENIGKPLKEWDISIYRGILTGYNKAFIIGNETKEKLIREERRSSEIIKPLLRGQDISRYKADWKGLWLIDTHNGYDGELPVDIQNYKAIKKYLKQFYPELKKRQDRGVTPYNLRNCAYYEEFEQDKLVWSDISTEPNFHILESGLYINNTAYMIVGKDLKYLLGVLNSSLISFYLPMIATGLGDKGIRYFKQFVEKLPVCVFRSTGTVNPLEVGHQSVGTGTVVWTTWDSECRSRFSSCLIGSGFHFSLSLDLAHGLSGQLNFV